jgi:4-hydroxybenzoate polyprenyltransferase
MNKAVVIFRLSRPLNALIIVAALIITRWVTSDILEDAGIPLQIRFIDFLLACFIGTLILAAGNVINDIIDRDIDVINKPERALIPAHISIQHAWWVYIGLNVLAMVLSIYLAVHYQMTGYLIIPVLAILFLYIYSLYLKKSPIWGNVMIAILCAGMPLVAFLIEYNSIMKLQQVDPDLFYKLELKAWSMIVFCFLLVLMREIIKDCADIEGDKASQARTFPILVGPVWSNILVHTLMILYLMTFIWLGLWRYFTFRHSFLLWAIGIYCLVVLVSYLLLQSNENGREKFNRISTAIKIYLIFGLIFILF